MSGPCICFKRNPVVADGFLPFYLFIYVFFLDKNTQMYIKRTADVPRFVQHWLNQWRI